MGKSIVSRVAPFLGAALCLLLTVSASARQPYGRYYPSYAPTLVRGYGYGFGYVALPYGYTYNPRRAYRQALRYGYLPWPPRAPVAVYGYPYYGYALQPIGPVRVWSGPKEYLYRPVYEQPPRADVPPPAQSGPEVIPTPPSQ